MHSDETIDVCAPFWAFPGAQHGYLGGSPEETHGNDKSNGNKQTSDNNNKNSQEIDATQQHRFDGSGSTMNVDDSCVNLGGLAHEEHIADNVDGFLDDFLALAGNMSDGGGMAGGGDIPEEDLDWLGDMDLAAFLPPPPTVAAAASSSAAPNCGGDDNGGTTPSPPIHEIEAPLPAVMVAASEAGAAAPTPVPAAAAVPAPVPPPRAAAAVPAVGVVACPEGAPAARPDTASGIHAVGGPSGVPPGPSFGDDGGGGNGGGVSPKEQLRRQKVARYLEKKKRRRSTKAVCSYQSRQRVANARPRHKGRFLPLESEFVPIAELQRRQRASLKELRDKAAAARAGIVSPGHGQQQFAV